ncbi:hypothetical protein [Streptococcus acidominimus]|uniref:hypothetical protein n=1 Tax=Streptococcus acidominimus TaxID=1326 RepID=UPI000B1CD634|nr:hypothetical protein [Streptococcus acidominimus]
MNRLLKVGDRTSEARVKRSRILELNSSYNSLTKRSNSLIARQSASFAYFV